MKKPIPEGSKIAFLGYAVYEGLDRVVNKYVSDYFHCINLNIFFEVVSREFDDGSIYINYNDKEYKINRRQVVKVKRKKAKRVPIQFWIHKPNYIGKNWSDQHIIFNELPENRKDEGMILVREVL